jgi:hypothetical protein
MKTMRVVTVVWLVVLVGPSLSYAQYWGERVLEKGFEQTEFFFTPNHLMPYGIGSFKGTTAGLLNDPLQEIIVNPSRLGLDSTRDTWLYTDFRGAKNVKEENSWVVPAYMVMNDVRYASSSYIYPYPRLFLESRRELEPVFSGAAIFRPMPEAAPGLFIGATYQYILQDAKYYSVPQNIYKTAAGYDFNGRTVAAAEAMPIVDKYSGKDDMHQVGHFGSAFVRYSPSGGLDLGVKLSRASFTRGGSYGSSNYWDNSNTSTSLWGNMEMRSQSYGAWDLGGGLTYHFTQKFSLGVSMGNLWGDAVQALRDVDTSYYAYTSSTGGSYYNRSENGLYQWNHQGTTSYYGADLLAHTSPTTTLNLYYRHQKSAIDIGLASTILDTSFSTHTYTDNTQTYSGLSRSFLKDHRSGSGVQNITTDRCMGSVRWQIDDHVVLSVGVQLEWYTMGINTHESVLLANNYFYSSTNTGGNYLSEYSQDESKDLLWTFASKRTSLQIPVFLTIQTSKYVQFMIGLNRNMTSWSIDDVTLALFRYRSTMQNGVETRKTNFGERYTVPSENASDVRTTLLAGIGISPSEKLNLRLLMVPNFREGLDGQELDQLQLWLGLTVTP